MRPALVPPTLSAAKPDPKLHLHHIPTAARERRVRAAMLNAFAFGGTNASVVVRNPNLADAA
jgi:3-oxoacyl-[acyl-carrier-protein] synthase II